MEQAKHVQLGDDASSVPSAATTGKALKSCRSNSVNSSSIVVSGRTVMGSDVMTSRMGMVAACLVMGFLQRVCGERCTARDEASMKRGTSSAQAHFIPPVRA
jgi:hypothetical protein